MHRYEFELSVDLGKAIPEVGSLCSELNSHMSSVGFDEQLSISARVGCMTLESSRLLTKEEESEIVKHLNAECHERFSSLGIRCTNVRRQPGNAPQSAS